MKLVTFLINCYERVGSIRGEHVVDLREARVLHLLSKGFSAQEAVQKAHSDIPNFMIDFIEGGVETLAIARECEAFAIKNKEFGKVLYSINDVKLKAPIQNPPMILNMGNAYRPNKIRGFGWKPITGLVGQDEPIIIPKEITDFGATYEIEIGTIIGRKGRRIPNNQTAYDYVYGYTIYNDVSDYGKQIDGIFGSKIHNTFCPMGPCIVTKDELGDPHNLIIKAWINDLLATESSTRHMYHKISEFISIPSQTLTLQPGTVISSGTPNTGRIKPGDVVEFEIEKIGKLRNPVIAE